MDGFLSQLLVGAGNLGIGFTVGWLFRGSRAAKQTRAEASRVNSAAILDVINEVESSAFAQARSWSALRKALGTHEVEPELRPFVQSNECYGQLLQTHQRELTQLDPNSVVVTQGLQRSLEDNQRGVRGLTDDLRAGNETGTQVDVAKLLARLEKLETSNDVLCEELVSVRNKAAEQSMELEKTRSAALEDFLTKLPNRRAFDRRFAEACAAYDRHGHAFCIALLDLDRFKQVNDTHGHDAGDSVLSVTGRVLGDTCRTNDFVARFGGEEFVILMSDSDLDGARILCERIRARLETTVIRHEDTSIRVTCSIGLAQAGPGCNGQQVLRSADELLYYAKGAGRNRVCDAESNEAFPVNGKPADVAELVGAGT